jgi:hypothetical protein
MEFVNKLNKELFKLLEIKHTTATPGHTQCNAQAEVFNKTLAKYLASFVDESTLDSEQYLPALQFSYNTSYHSTISTTPFELLYGLKPRTSSIPGQDVQRKFYRESFAAEQLLILQKARQIAKENMDKKQKAYKELLGKKKKFAPKYCGLAIIIDVNDSVAKLKTEKNKLKTINFSKLIHFFEDLDADAPEEKKTRFN